MRKLVWCMVSVTTLMFTQATLAANQTTAATPAPATSTAASSTAPLKIGVIDVRQIMQKSNQVAAINKQLTAEFQPRQAKIQAAQKSLQSEIDQLNRNSTTMSDADKNKLQDQIIADKANVQGMMLSFQRDVSTAQNQALQSFMAQLTTVVNNVAKAGNYSLILQKAGVPYASSNLDITNQVLQALNK